jgi:hypothetical protein
VDLKQSFSAGKALYIGIAILQNVEKNILSSFYYMKGKENIFFYRKIFCRKKYSIFFLLYERERKHFLL